MTDLTDQLASHARHADEIWASQHLSPITLTSKKGLEVLLQIRLYQI